MINVRIQRVVQTGPAEVTATGRVRWGTEGRLTLQGLTPDRRAKVSVTPASLQPPPGVMVRPEGTFTAVYRADDTGRPPTEVTVIAKPDRGVSPGMASFKAATWPHFLRPPQPVYLRQGSRGVVPLTLTTPAEARIEFELVADTVAMKTGTQHRNVLVHPARVVIQKGAQRVMLHVTALATKTESACHTTLVAWPVGCRGRLGFQSNAAVVIVHSSA